MKGNITKVMVLTITMVMGLGLLVAIPGETEAATPDWIAEAQMPVGTSAFAYAKLNDGRVFSSMGYNSTDFTNINATYIYDPVADAWAAVASSPKMTYGSAAVAMPDGNVYIFGGYDWDAGGYLKNVLIYNVLADEWTIGPVAIAPSWNCEAAAVDDATVLIAGGENTSIAIAISDCYFFDIETLTFTTAASLPAGRSGGSLVASNDRAYYIGGYDVAGTPKETIYAYSIIGDSWYGAPGLDEANVGLRAVLASDGLIYTAGGGPNTDWYTHPSERCYLYADSSGIVKEIPSLDVAPKYAGLVELDDGRLFVWGGHDGIVDLPGSYSLKIWTMEAWLEEGTAGTGGSVRVYISMELAFHQSFSIEATAYLVDGDTNYATAFIASIDSMTASCLMTVPQDLSPGAYEVALDDVYIESDLGWFEIQFDPMSLTVVDAPSLQDRIDDLQGQVGDLSTELNQTQDDLAAANGALDDIKSSKMDAVLGYLIIILVIIVLVMCVLLFVRKKS